MRKLNKIHDILNIALKKGDERAFKTIFELHYKSLVAYVNTFTNYKSCTYDIVQDTFKKLWEKRDNFDADHSIKGFLYKTAYNTFIDNYRKNKREREMFDILAHKKLMDLIEEDEETKAVKIKKIWRIIDKLPERCRQIFIMSKFEGLKYVEIADNLNISVKTVEAQMGKAFAIIRNEFTNSDGQNR